MLAIGVLLTVGTGFFVASEFALVNLDRSDLEAREAKGETHLGITIRALKITSTHLSSAQLGITLTTLLTGYTLEPALSSILAGPLTSLGLPGMLVQPVSTVIAIVIATLVSMIIGELVPKNIALALPRATAKIVIPFQVGFTMVFRPVVALLNNTANAILRMVGIEPKEELSSARTAEELTSLVRRSAREGSLDRDTATLLARTLVFSDLTAQDVMTPRPRVKSVDRTDRASDVITLARTTGFSRFLVLDDSIDEVVGLVHIKQAVAVPRDKRAEVPVSALLSEPLRVPETMKLDVLLAELRGRGFQMAVVVDEYGGTAGVATLEDLVEELVGEVSDEHDRTKADVIRSRDWFTFPGILRPDELLERTSVRVPEEGPYETVAGWLMAELGRLPLTGDIVTTENGIFRIERLEGRRIDRVRYTPTAEPEAVEADARSGSRSEIRSDARTIARAEAKVDAAAKALAKANVKAAAAAASAATAVDAASAGQARKAARSAAARAAITGSIRTESGPAAPGTTPSSTTPSSTAPPGTAPADQPAVPASVGSNLSRNAGNDAGSDAGSNAGSNAGGNAGRPEGTQR
ncbi:MAG: conserved rane protein [Glaciihabitans sp.]|nr:conserved rane protein [Glaciihabitans sp.]